MCGESMSEEKVIRYYIRFLPPYDTTSILDIGAGVRLPYRGLLKARCKEYYSLDIRKSEDIDFHLDISQPTFLADYQFEWGWCSEVIEHITQDRQEFAVKEVLRICKNAVFTYPTPKHPSFDKDSDHKIVIVDFDALKYLKVKAYPTKTGRNIFVCHQLDVDVISTNNGFRYIRTRQDRINKMRQLISKEGI